MPRGFVNRRDRFKWENMHYPEGETKPSGQDVIVDPDSGETLDDALTDLDQRISILENEFGNTGELLQIRSSVDAPAISGSSITITVDPEQRGKKGAKKK